jgi:glycyl-tRNA synthetase
MAVKDEKLMERVQTLARNRGFVYPDSEIYGGMANTWDFGPLGVELKNNLKHEWWKFFVQSHINMVGIDSAIIMNPRVWEASGHVGQFGDVLVDCKKCKNRFRADHLIEDAIKIDVEGKPLSEISKIIKENNIKCTVCGASDWTEARNFNILFQTSIGVVEDEKSLAYLRGETAQGMFVNFKNIVATSRKRIPFGIAQIGKAFRNEITPGNYIFRTREFEIAEFEYFINPKDWEKSFEFWLTKMHEFAEEIGLPKEMLHNHEIPKEKMAHYSKRTVDIEFDFPFGQKELWGLAYRQDYDLSKHIEYSKEDLSYTDPATNERFVPHVIEPTFGVERTMLAILCSSYSEEEVHDESRTVLHLPVMLAPFKFAVLPLSKKPELEEKAKEIWEILSKRGNTDYDETQSIGRRYRRQDEIGTPYCITVDFESLDDNAITIRDRDTMEQKRIKISDLSTYFERKGL